MSAAKQFTVKELLEIRNRLSTATNISVATEFHRDKNVIARLRNPVSFKNQLAKAEGREKPLPKQKWPAGSEERQALVAKLRHDGFPMKRIAEACGVDQATVYAYFTGTKQAKNQHAKVTKKFADRRVQIAQLRSTGLKLREIGEMLKLTPAAVGYYTRTNVQNGTEISQNGAHQNGHNGNSINRNILFGIALSETERFIGLLSEKLSIPAEILRSRLSELLGHSPLR